MELIAKKRGFNALFSPTVIPAKCNENVMALNGVFQAGKPNVLKLWGDICSEFIFRGAGKDHYVK